MTDALDIEQKEIATRATLNLMKILMIHGKDFVDGSREEKELWFDLYRSGMMQGLKEAKNIINTQKPPTPSSQDGNGGALKGEISQESQEDK